MAGVGESVCVLLRGTSLNYLIQIFEIHEFLPVRYRLEKTRFYGF